jgi:hypothetical protein
MILKKSVKIKGIKPEMEYINTRYKPIEVVDVDTGFIMSVKELKGKAYRMIEEVDTSEVINYVKWIKKTRYVKIIASQLKLF